MYKRTLLSKKRIVLFLKSKVWDILVTTHIKGSDDDFSALHGLGSRLVRLELLFLRWELRCAHEQELCSEKANALSITCSNLLCILRITDIAIQMYLCAISCDCVFASIYLKKSLVT